MFCSETLRLSTSEVLSLASLAPTLELAELMFWLSYRFGWVDFACKLVVYFLLETNNFLGFSLVLDAPEIDETVVTSLSGLYRLSFFLGAPEIFLKKLFWVYKSSVFSFKN